MGDFPIDVNEIVGPMILQRDKLLTESEQNIAYAAQAREEARKAAERALEEGERVAEGYEHAAAQARAYAEHWSGVIAREQAASAPQDPAVTRTDGEVTQQ